MQHGIGGQFRRDDGRVGSDLLAGLRLQLVQHEMPGLPRGFPVPRETAHGLGPVQGNPAAPALVVDLSRTGYLDSAGFAVLDHLLAKAALAVVVTPGSVLRTAAELMSIPIYDTIEQAGASLRSA